MLCPFVPLTKVASALEGLEERGESPFNSKRSGI